MKCNCGGKLKRVRTGTYQCLLCGKYLAVAFAEFPVPEITPNINDTISTDFQDKVINEIANTFRIPIKYFTR